MILKKNYFMRELKEVEIKWGWCKKNSLMLAWSRQFITFDPSFDKSNLNSETYLPTLTIKELIKILKECNVADKTYLKKIRS